MRTEQRTVTTIIADEGKLLRRKSDQWVAGEQVTLGYNYYEGGVGLAEAKLETPEDYEEFDKPENYEEPQIIDDVKRIQDGMKLLENVSRRMEEEKENINNLELTNSQSLQLKEMFPVWSPDGESVKAGDKYQYGDKLFEVVQDHVTQSSWSPDSQSSLWVEVTENKGTFEDPIPYNEAMNPMWQGMILYSGKYYRQGGIIYKCTRDSVNKLVQNLADLVGHYVQVAESGDNVGTDDADGTIDNPIPYSKPMEIFEGKYYIQDGVKYKCTRNSGMPMSYNLYELIGQYVEKV